MTVNSRGIVVLAQNNLTDDYVKQACLLAMSLKLTNPLEKISIITNNPVDDCYKPLFDNIIEIPWGDAANNSLWKIENRWKIYHITPYEKTIVFDTDMLVLSDISNHWNFLSKYKLYITSDVLTYRNELVTSNFYRKTFTKNFLPNMYTGFHYFEKSELAFNFYTWLEIVMKHWKEFYNQHLTYDRPDFMSVDVCAAIVAKILNCEEQITSKNYAAPKFVHMKPAIQNWNQSVEIWANAVGVYLTNDCNLKIGNFLQKDIFHYTDKNFVTPTTLNQYRRLLNV